MTKAKGHLILVALIMLFQADILCQKVLDPEFNPPDKRFDNFLVNNGEASQTSTSILIDSRGFLWCGTETGLYRYDGARYIEYKVAGSGNGRTGRYITRIFEDSRGTIWAGSTCGLNRIDQVSGSMLLFVPDPMEMTGNGNAVRTINQGRDGLLWIRTGKNVFSFDRSSGKFTKYKVDSLSWYPLNQAFQTEEQCFLEDGNRNKWFVTAGGLYRYTYEGIFRKVLPEQGNHSHEAIKRVNCITAGKDGTIWIGTDGGGLMRWNSLTDSPEKVNLVPGGNDYRYRTVTSILVDKNGFVWAFGPNSFTRYNPSGDAVLNYIFMYGHETVYETREAPVPVSQSFQLTDGTIWFFSRGPGLLYRFEPLTERLVLYRTPNFVVFQCLLDKSDSFWFACIRSNIFRMVRAPLPYFTIYPVNNTSDVAQVHKGTIIEDKMGRTWFLFNQGMCVVENFDISTPVKFNRITLPDGEKITSGGFTDSRGYLWFGSKTGRITRYDPASGSVADFTLPFPPDDIGFARVPMIREDKTGNIWIASFNHGLYRLAPGARKLELAVDLEPRSVTRELNQVTDFIVDSNNNLWLLLTDRILKIELPGIKVTDYSDSGDASLSELNSNLRVKEDNQGNIWLLNALSGLNLFDRNSGSFKTFSIPGNTGANAYYDLLIGRSGKFWIAHNRGITVFDPAGSEIRNFPMSKLQFDVQAYQLGNGKVVYVNELQLFVFSEDIPLNNVVPPVKLTRLLINGKDYELKSGSGDLNTLKRITLPSTSNTLGIEFAALNFLNPEQNRYRFFMKGIDRDTVEAQQGATAEYRGMRPGSYTFWVTGSNNDGVWNPEGVTLSIRIHPPWFSSPVAYLFYVLLMVFLLMVYIRYRTFNLKREKERLEEVVVARTAELEAKNQQLAEIDRIKTTFFTDISHEIRTPLSLILAPLESISRDETSVDRMPELVGTMKRNAQRLMHLVNQLLDISRLDAGKMRINLVEEDLVKILRILIYEFLSLAESKKIHYVADLPDNEIITWFDRDKIEKIISNLLTNAFRYTPPGGSVQCIVRIEPQDGRAGVMNLNLKVIDTGPGISLDDQAKIFDRFFRVEGHNETAGHGTGIGLSLVREFITMLHGTIEVKSAPGAGSEFSVIIPLGKGHLADDEYVIIPLNAALLEKHLPIISADRYDAIAALNHDKKKNTVLIIEDNEDLRSFIRQSLANDYQILEAENGRTGINTAFTMMPDLVVTDIMMPDLDGIHLCSQLKNDERTSHIPIILLTARATTDDRIEGLMSGADDYIVKPFNMAELKTRISNLLVLRERLRLKYAKLGMHRLDPQEVKTVDDMFMQKLIGIINERLKEYSFDVGSLQEQLGMSRMHLSRKLKVLTGYSPGILIRNMRLEKAAELLSRKAGNITEVANSVGMSNPSNFAKAFRSYFGVSPKSFSRN